MSQEDISLDEKRIYGDKRDVTELYVASGLGLARIDVSGDQAGRMSLVFNGTARDVAGGRGALLVATLEDVLIGTGDGLEPTDFGPAVAVGVGRDLLLAAGPDGEVARLAGDDWVSLGTVADPRRFDGDYLAAGAGVVRADRDWSDHAPLGLADSDVRDVAAAGPYAATADGCYRLTDDEWTLDREGACEVVAASGERAHLVVDGALFERAGTEWFSREVPVDEPIVDLGYGEATYAVTADGTFLVDADPETTPDGGRGWRHRSLGLPSVTALAVP